MLYVNLILSAIPMCKYAGPELNYAMSIFLNFQKVEIIDEKEFFFLIFLNFLDFLWQEFLYNLCKTISKCLTKNTDIALLSVFYVHFTMLCPLYKQCYVHKMVDIALFESGHSID